MIPTFRVSHVAAYARWRDDQESDVGWLINSILGNEESEAMRKGTAFHKYLETAQSGTDVKDFTVDGYRFVFTCDAEIVLPQTRETRKGKDYGGIVISGQADALGGKAIVDHKTTERFDAEKYLEGWQWRYYLDIFGADQFTWNVWEMKEIDPKVYDVYGLHKLSQYRYPELEKDCRDLALEFKSFADVWVIPKMGDKCVHAPEPPKPEWTMQITKGTNVIAVGWRDGTLRVCFAGKNGATFGRYTGVPEAEKEKLLRSPFPDKLFFTNIKGKFPYEREAA